MDIEFKGNIVSGNCDLEYTKLVCVPSHKYQTVELCLKSNGTKGMNIVIGSIDCAIDYPDKKKLGFEIEKRWNEFVKEKDAAPEEKEEAQKQQTTGKGCNQKIIAN